MADDGHTEPRILIDDRQSLPLPVAALERLAAETLLAEGLASSELSLSFVTEDEIAGLHERYLHEAGPTDVLSFPLDEDDVDEHGVRVLGDVVIAPSVAARNNPQDRDAELRLLVVHGILHLLGHDHDEDEERAAMWAKQERYAGVEVP
ncbi:MAG TPA: rRNA maturation RNase YbeY [Actinomycetota bacterium]|nr:rRNA maturation RNase YbeY [Actinomycetota bacterium]